MSKSDFDRDEFERILRSVNCWWDEDHQREIDEMNSIPKLPSTLLDVYLEIEEFIGLLEQSQDLPFEVVYDQNGDAIEIIENRLSKYVKRMSYWSTCHFDSYRLSERVMLFFETYLPHQQWLNRISDFPLNKKEHGKNVLPKTAVFLANDSNDLISRLREQLSSREFRVKLISRVFNCNRNYVNVKTYINALFETYARLNVVRVDLSYEKDSIRGVDLQLVVNDRKRFLNNARMHPSIFGAMVGYVWKLEFADEKKYHYHFFFFFNGSVVNQDIVRGKMIGEYWEKITDYEGIYYNCNGKKGNYKYLGIGMINHYDSELRANLLKAMSYLCKSSQYLLYKELVKQRTFQMGMKPVLEGTRQGRPRTRVEEIGGSWMPLNHEETNAMNYMGSVV